MPPLSPAISSSSSTGCQHRKHRRLDNLRTLILSNNELTSINCYAAQPSAKVDETEDYVTVGGEEATLAKANKSAIIFPALSMLDVSGNRIDSVPSNIHELANLSVLDVSRNAKITDLPPQMGLLYK